MGSAPEDSGSDNDNERPVREKLKKASLGAMQRPGSNLLKPHNAGHEEFTNESTEEPQPALAVQNTMMEQEKSRSNPPDSNGAESELVGLVQPKEPVLMATGDERASGDLSQDISDPNVLKDSSLEKSNQVIEGSESGQTANHASAPLLKTSSVEHDGTPAQNTNDDVPTETSDSVDTSMEFAKDGIKIPKKKRSRDQFNEDLGNGEEADQGKSEEQRRVSEDFERPSGAGNRTSRTIRDEPEKKRHRDASQEAQSKDLDLKTAVSPIVSIVHRSSFAVSLIFISHRKPRPADSPTHLQFLRLARSLVASLPNLHR